MNCDGTILKIKLCDIVSNYNTLKRHMKVGSEIAAVVKANAYGLGQQQVVSILRKNGCKKFCVSSLDEAFNMPSDGAHIEEQLFIMHGVSSKDMAETCAAHGFTPVLNHLAQIEYWNNAAKKHNKQLNAVIQFDTGMGRFGLSESEVKKLMQNEALLSHINVEYVMSHMSCAEQTGHPLTLAQLQLFKSYKELFPKAKATFANSAGIFLGEQFHFDMVRPGCALYGINPTSGEFNPMKGVVELHGYIVQKRIIEKEQFIGYRAQYQAQAGDRLLVIECGYADGYVRSLSNRGICYSNGYFMPVVGIISMDVVIVDATALPEQIYNSITHVEMLGENISIDDVAKYANTISYEILTTRFGNRCKRFYIE